MEASSETSFPAWMTLADARAAQVLADPEEARFLSPYLARECLISQAARALGVSRLRMYRHTLKLEALGLLRQVRTLRRAGKPMHLYRSSADAFFVPFRLTPADTLEHLMLEGDDHQRRMLFRGLSAAFRQMSQASETELGLRWYRDDLGRVTRIYALGSGEQGHPGLVVAALEEGAPALWSDWSLIQLERDEAKTLQRELADLYRKYYRVDAQPGRRHPYLMRLALAPLGGEASSG